VTVHVIPDGRGEALYLEPRPDDTPCEIHDWSFERLARELVPLMRARHGKGGVNACRECLAKAKCEADARRAARETGAPR
jgi:hypothetical protein